jgi:hypothetical protein
MKSIIINVSPTNIRSAHPDGVSTIDKKQVEKIMEDK